MANSFDPYGPQPTGWNPKTLPQIQLEVDSALRSGPLGQSAGSESDGTIPLPTIAGQLETIVVVAFSALWDLAQVVAAQLDPSQAFGNYLAALSALTGTLRDPAASSTATVTCTGVPGTQLPPGQTVTVTTSGTSFVSQASATDANAPSSTIGSALAAWVVATLYAAATRITNANGVFLTMVPGTSAVAPVTSAAAFSPATVYSSKVVVSDPATGNLWWVSTTGVASAVVFPSTGTPGSTTVGAVTGAMVLTLASLAGTGLFCDGAVTWLFLGAGTGCVDVPFQAATAGALQAVVGSLTNITTPVFGWNGAYNILDAVIGQLVESDSALRLRRAQELHSSGNAAVDAIQRAVSEVGQGTPTPVTACTVYFNDADTTGFDTGTGSTVILPPHSVMIVADYANSGDDADLDVLIAQAIWDSVGAGIATTAAGAGGGAGGTPMAGNPIDSQGNTQTVYWVRPTLVQVGVVANVTYDTSPNAFPPGEGSGANAPAPLTKGAITTFALSYQTGRDVYASPISGAVFDGPTSSQPGATPVGGILDVAILIGLNPPTVPTSAAKLPMTAFQRAAIEATNITVNLTGAAP